MGVFLLGELRLNTALCRKRKFLWHRMNRIFSRKFLGLTEGILNIKIEKTNEQKSAIPLWLFCLKSQLTYYRPHLITSTFATWEYACHGSFVSPSVSLFVSNMLAQWLSNGQSETLQHVLCGFEWSEIFANNILVVYTMYSWSELVNILAVFEWIV